MVSRECLFQLERDDRQGHGIFVGEGEGGEGGVTKERNVFHCDSYPASRRDTPSGGGRHGNVCGSDGGRKTGGIATEHLDSASSLHSLDGCTQHTQQ